MQVKEDREVGRLNFKLRSLQLSRKAGNKESKKNLVF